MRNPGQSERLRDVAYILIGHKDFSAIGHGEIRRLVNECE